MLILHGEASAQVLRDILVQQLMRNDPVHHVAGGRYVELRDSFCVSLMIPASGITNNVTLPFVLAIAGKGWREALSEDPHLRDGLNIYAGSVTHPAVARDLQLPLLPAAQALTQVFSK